MCYPEPETHCDEITLQWVAINAKKNYGYSNGFLQINAEEWEHETTPGPKLKSKAYTVNFLRSQSSQTSLCKYFKFYFLLHTRKHDKIKRYYAKQNLINKVS